MSQPHTLSHSQSSLGELSLSLEAGNPSMPGASISIHRHAALLLICSPRRIQSIHIRRLSIAEASSGPRQRGKSLALSLAISFERSHWLFSSLGGGHQGGEHTAKRRAQGIEARLEALHPRGQHHRVCRNATIRQGIRRGCRLYDACRGREPG
jgi:hypothetical protein